MNEKQLREMHERARKNLSAAYDGSQSVREKIVEAMRFVRVPGAQWEGSTFAGYDLGKLDKYPRFEINKVARECDRIISEYRKNRIAVRFRPNDGEAPEELAERLNGKFRADWEMSSGNEAGDNAFDDAVAGGMGAIRIEAIYEDELNPLNDSMRLVFRPVYDAATSVFFDPDSKDYDRSDAKWAMELFSMTPEAFEEQYQDAQRASMEVTDTGKQFDWDTPEAIYVGRYYETRIENATLQAYMNPMTGEVAVYDEIEIKDVEDDLLATGFNKVGEPRKIKRKRVYCGIMSGSGWLEEPSRIPGQFIPLVPVYGKRWFVDNQERIEGHACKAMDAQRLENLMVSMMADNATQSGGENIPIVDIEMIPGSLATHWAERNTKRPAFLPMKSLRDQNGTVISQASVAGYTPPVPMSPALAGLLQYTGGAIQQVTGSNAMENIPSNIATDTVDSIFNRMDTQSFIYMDNMAKSMRQLGRVWLSMSREVYGSDKPVRVLSEDGTDSMELMSVKVMDGQTERTYSLNDLSQSAYEVTVDVGQSFATRRDATVKSLMGMLQGIPPQHPYYSLIMGMIIDNMDGEGVSDMKKYNRQQMILQGVMKPKTDEEKMMVIQAQQAQQNQPDPMMVSAQAQMAEAQASMVKAQNEQASIQIKAFTAQADAELKQAQTIKAYAEAKGISEDKVREAMRLMADLGKMQSDEVRQNMATFANNK